MFHCTFWFGDHGFSSSNCTSLVVSVEGHHQTAYHSKNPWPHIVLSWPYACLSMRAYSCNFLSSIAQEHLPWSIFHARLSHPSPFCEPATTHPSHWPTLFCLNWFTPTMCPWHRHMYSVGPISWMWMHYTFGSHGMFWWWILIQPLVIYRTVLKICHLSSGIGSPHVACLLLYWATILGNSIDRVIFPSMYAQDDYSLPTDLPYYWVDLYAIWHIFLVKNTPPALGRLFLGVACVWHIGEGSNVHSGIKINNW